MDEGTIFQPQNEQNQPSQPIPVNPPVNSSPPPASVAPPVAQESIVSTAQTPPPQDNSEGPLSGLNIKKLLIGLVGLLVFIVVLLFVSKLLFGRSNPKTSESGNLVYWGFLDENIINQAIIAPFEKENPSIKVTYVKEDPGDYLEKLKVRIPKGNGPDVFTFHNNWSSAMQSLMLPLPEEVISQKQFNDTYYPAASTDLIKNGAIYGIPLEMDTLSLFVNTDLLNQASNGASLQIPKSWQDFITASQALTQRDDQGKVLIAGAGIGTYENVNHAPDILSLLFAQNGVNFQNPTDSQDRVSQALTFYTDFANTENNVWDSTQPNSLSLFEQGKLAMFFGYSYDYNAIKSQNPTFSFKVAPVPQLSSDNPKAVASYWATGVSSNTKNQKGAMALVKYLSNPDVSQRIYALESKSGIGSPYAEKNLLKNLENTDAFVFANQGDIATSPIFADNTLDTDLTNKLNGYLKDSVESILGGAASDQAAADLITGYSQVLSPQTNSSGQ